MYQAKICNLGLSLLIRLNPSDKYLSFLGGGTQRPCLNNQGRTIPAYDSFIMFYHNSKYDDNEILIRKDELINFFVPLKTLPSLNFNSPQGYGGKGLNKAGIIG